MSIDKQKINDWLQVIGMFGVVASLIFVGLEMRQTREIAVSQVYQSRAESEVAASIEASSNSAFHSASVKHYSGDLDSITPEEHVALDYHFGALVTLWENDHFQYQNGYLSEEHWAKTVKNMECTLGSPYFRKLLSESGWHLRESFATVIQDMARKATSDPLDCWDNF